MQALLLSARGVALSLLCSGLLACSGVGTTDEQPDSAPVTSGVRPQLPDWSAHDLDRNRIDDELDAAPDGVVELEVILNRPTEARDLSAFHAHGGQVQHLFASVSYGWTGQLQRAELHAVQAELGAALHFLAAPQVVVPLLDEATRTGRVRPVWATNFAGTGPGFSGSSSITVGVIDTGFDASHPDLNGRMEGFKDYSPDAATQPRDVAGHGTHVASIAVGSGAAFGLGPGTLRYTNTGDLSGYAPGSFSACAVHTPSYFGSAAPLTVSATAAWFGDQSASLRALRSNEPGGNWTSFALASGVSPLTLPDASSNVAAPRYSDDLVQTNPASITNFAVANRLANYPAVGDGFNAMRGVAPTSKWFGAKVFTDKGIGNSNTTGAAIDDLVNLRITHNIKVVNLSLTAVNGLDPGLRAKVNTAVDHGVVVLAAAGNAGPNSAVADPARARKAIAVGATNDLNQLTIYTSAGFETPTASEDAKPDVLAPGGSNVRSLMLAADSNSSDGRSADFRDLQADDYTGLQGTSMASPFAAGACALLIEAWQRAGKGWDFSSDHDALRIKMLLLASASETNAARETGTVGFPTLGRAARPKDLFEGYGLLNPDAAIEAITLALPTNFAGVASDGAPARVEWEQRAWGRHVSLSRGDQLTLTLAFSSGDFDLYLIAEAPDANGNPVVRAASTAGAAGGKELISFTAQVSETAYVFVKRVQGVGNFGLSSAQTCEPGPCMPNNGNAGAGAGGSGSASSSAGGSLAGGSAGSDALTGGAGGLGEAGALDGSAGDPEMGGAAGAPGSGAAQAGAGGDDSPSSEAGSGAVASGAGGASGEAQVEPSAATAESSGCGCSVAGAGDRTRFHAWLLLGLFGLLLRRKERALH